MSKKTIDRLAWLTAAFLKLVIVMGVLMIPWGLECLVTCIVR